VKALAHITGGGFWENIPPVLPDDMAAELDASALVLPDVFRWLAETGGVSATEMARTFNCGMGMIVVVAADQADAALAVFADHGETASVIGHMRPRGDGEAVRIDGLDAAWALQSKG
jgi:phosphoribosylformylglycinamidine cyclo-ligase